ncbi:hypothetical protein SG34_029715 [Thalassomonas viridans]|uniref:Uncharacterized protein n=1 Tax=Thalassomonas viridans TaxID=137584 RepID=A0AAE9ZAH2_9GAMM|nr:hypothetical protein [Thalassomonas viridans]WDE08917.1 hypothetical protein SG34_034080 [Thalassomonas viridans]WDE08964.1 hypothetical protein SG34_029715 [Thalassomonas viridans]
MSPHRFWSTISSHIGELTNEDLDYIIENYSIDAKRELKEYVSQEFNLTQAALKTSLLEIAPHSKRALKRLNYPYSEHNFEQLLFSIGIYIFSTWHVELHQIMGAHPKAERRFSEKEFSEKEFSEKEFGEVELF